MSPKTPPKGETLELLECYTKFARLLFTVLYVLCMLPWVPQYCWLGEHPACKNRMMRCWCGCLLQDANGLQLCVWSHWCHCHPIVFCFIKIQNGLTLLVLAYPDCPEKEAIKSVCLSIHSLHIKYKHIMVHANNVSITNIKFHFHTHWLLVEIVQQPCQFQLQATQQTFLPLCVLSGHSVSTINNNTSIKRHRYPCSGENFWSTSVAEAHHHFKR